ncbi:hypothetical protein J6590_041437 [Homalodisca vitripennis]|nr:hypothetical protein J6590_041437 [Homalodisca vitripennis]
MDFTEVLRIASYIADATPPEIDKDEVLNTLLYYITKVPPTNIEEVLMSTSALKNVLLTLSTQNQTSFSPNVMVAVLRLLKISADIFSDFVYYETFTKCIPQEQVKQISMSMLGIIHATIVSMREDAEQTPLDGFSVKLLHEYRQLSLYAEDTIEFVKRAISYLQRPGMTICTITSMNGFFSLWAMEECICARSVGLPCGLPTKPPTGHGGLRPEPFRMTSCLVRVSYVPTRTKGRNYLFLKLGVSQAPVFTLLMKDCMYMSSDCIPGVLTLQHHVHNGLCRNITNCGGERSTGLGEAPASEEGVMNIIIFLRAISTPRRPDFSHPVEVLPKVTVPRQELTQVEIYLPVATIYPGLKLSNETEGPATVRSFRPPPLPNLQSLHPGSSQGILSTPIGGLPEDGLSLDGQQVNRNHPSHDRHGRNGNGAIGAGDPKCRSSLYR